MAKASKSKFEKDLRTLQTQLAKVTAKIEAITAAITEGESPAKKVKQAKAAPTPKKKPAKTKPAAKKKTPAKKKAPARKKAAPKANRAPARDQVLDAIKAAADGIGTADLAKSLGISLKSAQNAVFRLKKQGKVVMVKRGVYKAS